MPSQTRIMPAARWKMRRNHFSRRADFPVQLVGFFSGIKYRGLTQGLIPNDYEKRPISRSGGLFHSHPLRRQILVVVRLSDPRDLTSGLFTPPQNLVQTPPEPGAVRGGN